MHVYVLWQKQKSLLPEKSRMRERKSLMKSKWLKPIKTNNRLIDPKLKLNVLRQIEMADGKGGGYLWVQIAPTTNA